MEREQATKFMHDLLRLMLSRKGSDLFITTDFPPAFKIDGKVTPVSNQPLSAAHTVELARAIMNDRQAGEFEANKECNFAISPGGLGRFRVSAFVQQGHVGMVLRTITTDIPKFEDLGLPDTLKEVAMTKRGLVIMVGATGSGKSTTLAAMINQINATRKSNIITVEDPIEFVHPDKMGIVSQREVGIDTESFTVALKYVVRQSPDVILIGEMRDVETMNVAMQASETGHLVFSTVHTPSAGETMDRIVNMFPPHEKPQICMRMATSLRGVVSQKLVPRADGSGRLAAVEVMIATPTVSKLVEEGRFGQLYSAITEGNYWGMQTMNQCLLRYFKAGLISEEDALGYAGNITELRQMIRRP
jgi:twitching motility protein PilU